MATSKKNVPATLAPTVVKNETQAFDVATSSGRKRPFVAINDDGKLVVCSRRTAAKYGWEAQGALFSRTGSEKKADKPAKETKKAPWDVAADKQREKNAAPAQARNLSRKIKTIVRNELRSRFNEKG